MNEQGAGDKNFMYETELNLRDEDRITKRVADQYGGTFRKVTLPYRIDGVLEEDGRIIAFLEAKRRTHPSTRYSSLMISLLKWETGILHAQTTGLPFYIAIEFTDGLMLYKY